jgi:hypothetical protein
MWARENGSGVGVVSKRRAGSRLPSRKVSTTSVGRGPRR